VAVSNDGRPLAGAHLLPVSGFSRTPGLSAGETLTSGWCPASVGRRGCQPAKPWRL